jgi:cell division protein FtsI (penicillin-binding protein 3)
VENKKDILSRTYLMYVVMCVFAFAILYRICVIQFVEGDEWRNKSEVFSTKIFEIEAVRGNIFDANGSLLATSLPYYEVGMDICAPSIPDTLYKNHRDSLSYLLSTLFHDKSPGEYKRLLNKAREARDRYIVLQRNVSHKDLQILKSFPILRKGRRGGLVTLQTNRRERPFQMLAARTIGMARNGIKPVGLEGAFDTTLMGVSGKRLMQKIAGNVWRPINDDNEVEPKDGSDLYTTIDINIQDVAEHALLKALVKNQASHGCAVLMEVKTGQIKAIANLSQTKGGDSTAYTENLNYALGYPTEPGSTFKLASLLATIDTYDISLDEKIQVGNGECVYYDRRMKDAHAPKSPVITVQQAFETSSNVGISKVITKYFSKDPKQFTDKLQSFHLNGKLGLSIPGEGTARIKKPKDKDWYGTTLPWLSIGYESLVTPLHTLTLYNAIANNGTMVKPTFIKEIRRNGLLVKTFAPEIIADKIVKPSTIAKAKQLMEGVVKNGSGKVLNITAFKVGGKTGTAQIAKNGDYRSNVTYQASFVGYFPADNPLYTCIVIINNPTKGDYYGGAVSGPVFKEIAEKVYSSGLDFIKPLNTKSDLMTYAPEVIKTKNNEMNYLAQHLSIPAKTINESERYVSNTKTDSSKVVMAETNIETQLRKRIMPNVLGMSAKDALFLLENSGLHVKVQGFGSVKKQSKEAGQKFIKGEKIELVLSS